MSALRVLYVANVRIPSERANAYQILAQVDALTTCGLDVTILAPRRNNRFALTDTDIPKHYSLAAVPRIERLASLDLIDRVPPRFQRLPFVLQSLTFARSLAARLRNAERSIVYSRDAWSLALLPDAIVKRHAFFYEVHDLPEDRGRLKKLVAALSRCAGIVTITQGLKDDLVREGVVADSIEVLPDAFDGKRFSNLPTREAARSKLSLAMDRPLAVYTGHLFPWKGADTFVAAAARARFDALLVGGRIEDRTRIERLILDAGATNVVLHPPVPPSEVPLYLAAADVLVLPNSGKTRISERYTSPLKLFEYLAVRRPIVASNLSSIREILTDDVDAKLVTADDPGSLRNAIESVLADPRLAARLAENAYALSARYTFDSRATALRAFMQGRMEKSLP